MHDVDYPAEYEILTKLKTISQNNMKLATKIIQFLTYNPNIILKYKENLTDTEKEKLLAKHKNRIDHKRKIFKLKLDTKNLDNILHSQNQANKLFNNRIKLTTWNKIMIRYLDSIGYDINQITKALNLSSKHINSNVLHNKPILDKINQCPKCKYNLSKYIELEK